MGRTRNRRTGFQILKDIVLFFAAPFITLAFMLLFPSIALALLARAGAQAQHHPKASS